jgi:hypothetical protein
MQDDEGERMDGVRRKRCETCVHHVAGPTPCTGICRNLIWQPKTDAVRFVRDRELACYGGWEVDYWLPKPDAFPSNGSGGPNPGAGGAPGGGAGVAAYGTLFGAPRDRDAAFLWLIPIDLLAEYGSSMGLDPDPRDVPGFGE